MCNNTRTCQFIYIYIKPWNCLTAELNSSVKNETIPEAFKTKFETVLAFLSATSA